MKELTSYNRVTQYLNKVFKLINSEYFDNELEMPTITIQSTVGAYGHVTTSKVWKTESGKASYELNIGADYLDRPIENIVATLIHEGCHLYAMQNGIKDTSNRGVYHNKRFKALAEDRGLIIEKHSRYGWTITTPSEANGTPVKPTAPKKGNSIKWICPCCGAIVRSTKILNIVCGDCNEKFIQA